jgi:ubiquinone/menaquinone biosynthesis C-methylase UbiE
VDVLARAGVREGDIVLDVGGALVAEAKRLAGDDGSVIAVDPSPDRLDELRAEEVPGTAYLLGDAAVLPLVDSSVDVVLAPEVPDAAELLRVLRPAGRVACPGGDDVAAALAVAGFVSVEAVDGVVSAAKDA